MAAHWIDLLDPTREELLAALPALDPDVLEELVEPAAIGAVSAAAARRTRNEVLKKLAVIASLLFLPALIVGFYGQNFEEAFGRPYWSLGVSSGLIAASTVAQIALFKWRQWI